MGLVLETAIKSALNSLHSLVSSKSLSRFAMRMRFFALKYKSFLTVLAIALFACGCQNKQAEPDDLLDFNAMVNALEMIYVNEVKAIGTYDLGAQKDEYMRKYLYPAIFDSLQITDSVFYSSYAYYEQQPKVFESLLDSVIVQLEQMPADTSVENDIVDINDAYKQIRNIEQGLKDKADREKQ